MKANIRERKGFTVGPMGELVEFDDIANFQIDVDVMLNTADEPFLVIFDDGAWAIHNRVETDDLVDDPMPGLVVHQAIPFNVLFRDFIAFEAHRPVLNATYATPVPEQ